jgi:hypothetical protein
VPNEGNGVIGGVLQPRRTVGALYGDCGYH